MGGSGGVLRNVQVLDQQIRRILSDDPYPYLIGLPASEVHRPTPGMRAMKARARGYFEGISSDQKNPVFPHFIRLPWGLVLKW